MKILHLSALPVLPLEGKGGMPSLREALRGRLAAACGSAWVLPRSRRLESHSFPAGNARWRTPNG